MSLLTKGLCKINIGNLHLLTNEDLLRLIFNVWKVQTMKLNKQIKSAAAAYILGLRPMAKAKGSVNEVSAFSDVLKSSRKLYVVLNESPTNDQVAAALAEKTEKAEKFKEVFGHVWPF